jgi:hypothetical protein
VNRGGSFNNNASNLRASNRNNNSPGNRNNNLGLRCSKTGDNPFLRGHPEARPATANGRVVLPSPALPPP